MAPAPATGGLLQLPARQAIHGVIEYLGHADAIEQFDRSFGDPFRNAEKERPAGKRQREEIADRERMPGIECEPLWNVAAHARDWAANDRGRSGIEFHPDRGTRQQWRAAASSCPNHSDR